VKKQIEEKYGENLGEHSKMKKIIKKEVNEEKHDN